MEGDGEEKEDRLGKMGVATAAAVLLLPKLSLTLWAKRDENLAEG